MKLEIFQEFLSNAITKPVNGRIYIKKEEYNESDTQETDCEIKTEDASSGNDDRTSQLISELRTIRTAYNDTFFLLQKANELAASRECERKCAAELGEKRESELRAQQRKNQSLIDELTKLKIDLNAAKGQLSENDTEVVNLRRENKILKARLNQLQHGINESRNVKAVADRPTRKKMSIPKHSNVFEVENLLNDEFRRGKHYFLVKWKGYDASHNSWEQQSNLNCPKILKKYLDNKK